MPPLPTIGNAVRVTLNWSSNLGITPRNVMHLITASADEQEIGEAIEAAAVTNVDMFQAIDDAFTLISLSILLLDGTTPTYEYTLVSDDVKGGGSGEQIPAAAAVLSMRTSQRGPRGRGRLYLGPVSEAALTDGRISESYRVAMVNSWDDFQDDLVASPIVASIGVASYAHAEINGVNTFSMRQAAGTLRRRQNQLLS